MRSAASVNLLSTFSALHGPTSYRISQIVFSVEFDGKAGSLLSFSAVRLKRAILMGEARFRFYAELNDFLPEESRTKQLVRRFDVSGSVKDLIESFGVPHTEVDFVLVNHSPVDFSHSVRDGDYVSVYPVFESLDISSVSLVRPTPLRDLHFVLDVHLGRLSGYLRMAGFDALYRNNAPDRDLADVVVAERRILLTRDRYLLMRRKVDRGYWVRSTDPKHQFVEVLNRFDLTNSMRPFTRCMKCNSILEEVNREHMSKEVPSCIAAESRVTICPTCRRVYWKGSHHVRMMEFLEWARKKIGYLTQCQ